MRYPEGRGKKLRERFGTAEGELLGKHIQPAKLLTVSTPRFCSCFVFLKHPHNVLFRHAYTVKYKSKDNKKECEQKNIQKLTEKLTH